MYRRIQSLTLLALLATLLAGCSKAPSGDIRQSCPKAGTPVTVRVPFFNASHPDLTKGTVEDTEPERRVNRAEVFVFGSDGSLLDRQVVTGTVAEFTLTAGYTYQFAAIINDPSNHTSVSTLSQFNAVMTSFATNTTGNFVMRGGPVSVSVDDDGDIPLETRRLATKVAVGGVTFAFPEGSLNASSACSVKSAFLTNIPSQVSVAGTGSLSTLINNGGVTLDANHHPVSGTNAMTYVNDPSRAFALYGAPNATAESASTKTGDNTTKLVLCAMIGETECFYVIPLPATTQNTIYTIDNIVIKNIGSTGQNVPVYSTDATFAISSVTSWTVDSVTSGLTF